MSSEQEFLRDRAAASGITPRVAALAVEQATGRGPRRVEQFDGGWGAVPFWAIADDGSELVVRVAIGDRDRYAREASVIARAAAEGIPVPEVVGVGHVEGHATSVLVRAPGSALSTLAQRHGADDEQVRRLWFEAGSWLHAIHRLDASGLDLEVAGPPVQTALDQLEPLVGDAAAGDIHLFEALIDELGVLNDPVPHVLNHHDYGADHILVADGRITAIIDWELAGFNDPARDLAWWRTYGPYMGGGEHVVRAGYGPPDAVLDERIRAWALAECIAAAAFNRAHGRLDAVALMAERARQLRA